MLLEAGGFGLQGFKSSNKADMQTDRQSLIAWNRKLLEMRIADICLINCTFYMI